MAVFFALMEPGDTLMGMNLSEGGHLTHGSPVNFSGRLYNVVAVRGAPGRPPHRLRGAARPGDAGAAEGDRRGAPAPTRGDRLRGLRRDRATSAARSWWWTWRTSPGWWPPGTIPRPCRFADVVTSTTHKTLRGPRGGLILATEEHAKAVDKQIFPGIQGGPLMHVIAAKAVAFGEALQPEFSDYSGRVIENAKALGEALAERGFTLVSGGTDNHLLLVDLRSKGVTGKVAEKALDHAGITVNKNTVPGETESPFVTSGIRIGTPALTTRGMGMVQVARLIDEALTTPDDATLARVRGDVHELARKHPLYPSQGVRS
jgi:glycine hydroxymethyltransferase